MRHAQARVADPSLAAKGWFRARWMWPLRDRRTVTGIFNKDSLCVRLQREVDDEIIVRPAGEMPPTRATAIPETACIQVRRTRGSLAAERIAEFPKKPCAVTPPGAAMHA